MVIHIALESSALLSSKYFQSYVNSDLFLLFYLYAVPLLLWLYVSPWKNNLHSPYSCRLHCHVVGMFSVAFCARFALHFADSVWEAENWLNIKSTASLTRAYKDEKVDMHVGKIIPTRTHTEKLTWDGRMREKLWARSPLGGLLSYISDCFQSSASYAKLRAFAFFLAFCLRLNSLGCGLFHCNRLQNHEIAWEKKKSKIICISLKSLWSHGRFLCIQEMFVEIPFSKRWLRNHRNAPSLIYSFNSCMQWTLFDSANFSFNQLSSIYVI